MRSPTKWTTLGWRHCGDWHFVSVWGVYELPKENKSELSFQALGQPLPPTLLFPEATVSFPFLGKLTGVPLWQAGENADNRKSLKKEIPKGENRMINSTLQRLFWRVWVWGMLSLFLKDKSQHLSLQVHCLRSQFKNVHFQRLVVLVSFPKCKYPQVYTLSIYSQNHRWRINLPYKCKYVITLFKREVPLGNRHKTPQNAMGFGIKHLSVMASPVTGSCFSKCAELGDSPPREHTSLPWSKSKATTGNV